MKTTLCETEVSTLTCRHCGSLYERTTVKLPWRDRGAAECQVCGRDLQRWNGRCIHQFRLVKRAAGTQTSAEAHCLVPTPSAKG